VSIRLKPSHINKVIMEFPGEMKKKCCGYVVFYVKLRKEEKLLFL